jgi:hypothetical protein
MKGSAADEENSRSAVGGAYAYRLLG